MSITLSLQDFKQLSQIDPRIIRVSELSRKLYKMFRKARTILNEAEASENDVANKWRRLKAVLEMMNSYQDEFEGTLNILNQVRDGRDPMEHDNLTEEQLEAHKDNMEIIFSTWDTEEVLANMILKSTELRESILTATRTLELSEQDVEAIEHGMLPPFGAEAVLQHQELGTSGGVMTVGHVEELDGKIGSQNVATKPDNIGQPAKVKYTGLKYLKEMARRYGMVDAQEVMKIMEDQQKIEKEEYERKERNLRQRQIHGDEMLAKQLERLDLLDKLKSKSATRFAREENTSQENPKKEYPTDEEKRLEELGPIFTTGEDVEENVNILVDHVQTMLQRNDITNTESAILFDVDLFLNNLLDIKQGLKRTIAHIEKEGNSDVDRAVKKDDLRTLMGEWNDIRKQA